MYHSTLTSVSLSPIVMDTETDLHAKYSHNRKVILGSAILLLLVILIVVFLHTCRHLCFRRLRRRRPLLFPHLNSSTTTASNELGLDPSLLKLLPTFNYFSATHSKLQDCAVCLSEFADGDEGRVLPTCNHAFHSNCIDKWFRSHSNCPLCRAQVQKPAASVQPLQATPPTASFNIEACSFSETVQMEESQVGCSSFSEIGCPIKPVSIIVEVTVEMPEAEEEPKKMERE